MPRPATMVSPSRPTRRTICGPMCWLPRPKTKPCPPVTPTTIRRGRPSTQAQQLRRGKRRQPAAAPSRGTSTPSSVPSTPRAAHTAFAACPARPRLQCPDRARPRPRGLQPPVPRRRRAARPALRCCISPLDSRDGSIAEQPGESRPARSASSSISITSAWRVRTRCRLDQSHAPDAAGRAGPVAKTPECIFTPVGMPMSGTRCPTAARVARRAVATGEEDQFPPHARAAAKPWRACRPRPTPCRREWTTS